MIGQLTRSTSDGSPDLHRTAGVLLRRTTIDAGSWPDRRAIVVWSPSIVADRRIRSYIYGSSTIAARSLGNQSPIAGRSCSRSRPIQRQNWGGFIARLKPCHRPKEPLPRPLQIAPTTAPISHDFWAKFLFKNWCISLLLFNFWSIHEGIKQISRKISSSSWSPRVYTRLRSNWSRIDHEFLLDLIEFSPCILNVHEEESEQIRFNPRELKPHSCGNWVSSEIWSIIRR